MSQENIKEKIKQAYMDANADDFIEFVTSGFELLVKASDYVGSVKNDFDDAKNLHDDISNIIKVFDDEQ